MEMNLNIRARSQSPEEPAFAFHKTLEKYCWLGNWADYGLGAEPWRPQADEPGRLLYRREGRV